MSDVPILAGALSDADLSSILGVTSLGRQTIRLEVFSAAGSLIGSAVLKAGRVLSASAGVHTGRAALKVLLAVQNTGRFRISREPGALPEGEPIALVHELQAAAPATPPDAPPLPPARIRVMDGSLRDFDVATLLQTVGLGRQHIQLDILAEDRRVIGWVLVKAGKVISAQSGATEGIAAVRELLDVSRDFSFAVYRLDTGVGELEPLGSIAQVLFQAEPRERRLTAPAPRTPVMRGVLSEFDVPTILYTLAIARQYNCIELYNQNETVGTIYAKAGMVMSAETSQLQGLAAFQALVNSPSHFRFGVFRVSSEVTGEPLGSIYQLLSTVSGGMPSAAAAPAAAVRHGTVPPATSSGRRTGTMPRVASPSMSAIPQVRDFSNSDRLTSITSRVGVMVGSTTDFSVRTLLETLTEIRQRTVVELLDGENMIGSIHVKAGKLLGARTETLSGIAAFRWLLSTPGHLQFRVFRYPGESQSQAEPIGTLYTLLSTPTATGAVAIGLEPEMTHRGRVHVPRYVWIATGIVAAAAGFLLVWRPAPRTHGDSAATAAVTAHSPASAPNEPSTAAAANPVATAQEPVAQAPAAEPAAVAPPAVAPPVVAPPAVAEPAMSPPAPAVAPPVAPSSVGPPRSQRKDLVRKLSVWKAQVMLRKLGFSVGPIDNIYGRLTKFAVQSFQRDMNLPSTGVLDEETMGLLMEKSPLKD